MHSRRSRAVTAKICTEKRDERADLFFTNLKLPFSLMSPSSLLKFLNGAGSHARTA